MSAGASNTTSPHTMQCMEVWGGNRSINNGVAMPGLDVWVYSDPFEGGEGGGDIHYVSSCATGRISRFLVADVSGHGTSVMDVADSLRTMLRRYANYLDQTRLVRELNREFTERDGGEFATSVVATYWAPTNVLVMCNAGHPPPYRYDSKSGVWAPLAPETSQDDGLKNLPLGVIEPTDYEQFAVRLRPGDLVLTYTDSLMEVRERGGEMLGQAGLGDVLNSMGAPTPERFIPDLLDAIETRCGRPPSDDDVTALLIRHNGTRPMLGLVDRLRGLAMLGRMMVRGVFPGGPPVPWPEMRAESFGINTKWGGKG